MLRIAKYFLLVFSFCALSGCATIGNVVEKFFLYFDRGDQTTFAEDLPEPVSIAWRDTYGDVWLVPKRGTLITSVKGGASWGTSGSYFVIRGKPQKIAIYVNNQWWNLNIPDTNN